MMHVRRLLVIVTAVMTLMIMTASIALAHPGNGDGIENAKLHVGVGSVDGELEFLGDPPAYSNEVSPNGGNGGLWGNPATADSEEGSVTGGTGADAMLMQVLHNPMCSAHAAH